MVDKANFNSERQVVEEELRQRVLASPYGRLFYYDLPEDSFAVHPYHRSAIGSIEDLDAASLDDVQNFHATYYRPDNATLVVVGNFDPAQLSAWIDQYFGPLKDPAAPIPQVTAIEPPRTGPRDGHQLRRPTCRCRRWRVTWLAPEGLRSGRAGAAGAGRHPHGRQVVAALRQPGLRQADAPRRYSPAPTCAQQLGMFYVGAIVAQGHTPDEVEAALRAQVAALRDAPVSPAELDIAKTQLLTQEIRQRETIDGRANELAAAQVIEGSAERANSDIAALAAVTPADVQRVARKYLPDDLRVSIKYLPESAKPPGAPAEAAPSAPIASQPYTGPVAALLPAAERQAPPPIGAQPPAVLPTPVERTLPNGLRVIVAHSDGPAAGGREPHFRGRRGVRSAAPRRRRQPHRLAGHRGHRHALGPRHRPPVRSAGRGPGGQLGLGVLVGRPLGDAGQAGRRPRHCRRRRPQSRLRRPRSWSAPARRRWTASTSPTAIPARWLRSRPRQ